MSRMCKGANRKAECSFFTAQRGELQKKINKNAKKYQKAL